MYFPLGQLSHGPPCAAGPSSFTAARYVPPGQSRQYPVSFPSGLYSPKSHDEQLVGAVPGICTMSAMLFGPSPTGQNVQDERAVAAIVDGLILPRGHIVQARWFA